MIELTNGVQISEDRLIQKATASVDSLSSTGKLEVMQYDDKMPVAAVTLTSKAVTWTPPEGAALRVRMGKPDGHGVLNDALGMDADGTVYFAFTRQMTAAHGTGKISVEIGSEGGVKSSAIVSVTVKKNPVQDDKIESGDEFLALDAILEQCQQAAKAVTENADALQTIRDNAEAIQTTAANIGAIKAAPAAAATVQQYSTQLQTLEENAGVVQQVAQNMNAIQAAPSAANTASEAARTAGTYAEAARQEAANAGTSAAAAKQSADAAAKSAEEAQKAAESAGVDDTTAGDKPWSARQSVASFAPLASALKVSGTGDGLVSLTPTAPWYFQGLQLFGKTTQDGTPSPENPVPLVSAGNQRKKVEVTAANANLCRLVESKAGSGIQITTSSDGTMIVNGTSTALYTPAVSYAVYLKKGITYTLFGCPKNEFGGELRLDVRVQTTGIPIANSGDGGNSATFVPDQDYTAVVCLRVAQGITVSGLVFHPMLVVGTKKDGFLPGKSQTLTYATPNGLPGIPVTSGGNYTDGQQWICDEVDFETGTYTQRCGVRSFNGDESENWVLETVNNESLIRFSISVPDIAIRPSGMSNLLTWTIVPTTSSDTEQIGGNLSAARLHVIILRSRLSEESVNGFKSWLSENPLSVIYQLAEPVTEPISAETLTTYAALQSNVGTTNILAEGCGIEATAIADAQTVIAGITDRLSALEQNAIGG